ncbi:hypothetical protein FRC10_001466 [Ceratobasidium sp. 414]|nr:hypothetical protein FRC10_001466 [Ceratobasidium sp. 414]
MTTPAVTPRRWKLMREGEDPNHVPWLERFDAWASKQGVQDRHWTKREHPQLSPRWHVTLRPFAVLIIKVVNGHNLPNFVGRGDTVQGAKANLVRQLEAAEPAVLALVLML